MKFLKEILRKIFFGSQRDEATVKSYVSSRARGNVRLQLGRIMTAREYDLRRKKVLSYVFG